jgi:DNA replication protein DnaC
MAKVTPTLHVPARFADRARFDNLDWIAKTPAGAKAIDHCKRFAENPAGVRAPLLMGPSACGKSHLLLAAARRIHEKAMSNVKQTAADAEKRLEARLRAGESIEEDFDITWPIVRLGFTNGAEIAHDLRQTVVNKNLDSIVAKYRQTPAPLTPLETWVRHGKKEPEVVQGSTLFVDDVEISKMSDWLGEELYRIYDHRYAENLPTAIATNLAPEELKAHLGDRIARRLFDMTEVFEIG